MLLEFATNRFGMLNVLSRFYANFDTNTFIHYHVGQPIRCSIQRTRKSNISTKLLQRYQRTNG